MQNDVQIPAGMKAYGPEHPDYPNAPRDWDKGPYLCRDGRWYHMRGYGWKHGENCTNPTADWDRIAYTARTPRTGEPVADEARAREVRRNPDDPEWSYCPACKTGFLDTGFECNSCGFDAQPLVALQEACEDSGDRMHPSGLYQREIDNPIRLAFRETSVAAGEGAQPAGREAIEKLFDQAFADGVAAGKTGDDQLLAGSSDAYAQAAIIALTPRAPDVREMREAAQGVLDRMFSTYKARNGREVGIQGDDGEKCWIVHSDDIEALRSALARGEGVMADDRDYRDDDECWNCSGEGVVYGCSWDWQCDTYDAGEGTCLCERRCDVCNPLPRDPELDRVLSDALAKAPTA